MSHSRLVVRVLLVLFLVGMLAVIGRAWMRSGKDYYWTRAEAARQKNDWSSAKLHLQNLLRKYPESDRGHLALAEVLLQEAKAAGQPASYASQPQALSHLTEAAKIRPDDADLQKELLAVFLEGTQQLNPAWKQVRLLPKSRELQQQLLDNNQAAAFPDRAAEAARRLLEKEPENPGALYVLAWRAVRTGNSKAEELVDRLRKDQASQYTFRALALAERLHRSQADQAREVLGEALERAGALTAQQLTALPEIERGTLTLLLMMAVDQAADASQATERTGKALDIYAKLSANKGLLGELATDASQLLGSLAAKYPLAKEAGENETAARQELSQKVEQLQQAAIDAKDAGVVVYHERASLALARNDFIKAVEVVHQGLEATKELPPELHRQRISLQLLAARLLLLTRRYDESKKQLEELLALDPKTLDKQTLGWVHLLSGGVDTAQGRQERALAHYMKAQQHLGRTLFVQMALADTNLKLRRWSDALTYLTDLHGRFSAGDAETQYWATQHNITESSLHFSELRAYLSQGKWQEAQPHLEALRGTRLESAAQATAVTFLWTSGKLEEAQQRLTAARQAFPDDLTLVQLEVTLLQQANRADDATKLLEKVAADKPEELARQMLLSRWYATRKELDKAMQVVAEMEKNFADDPRVAVFKGELLLAQGKVDEAAGVAEALKRNPQTAAAGNVLAALAAVRTKNFEGAAQQLSDATGLIGHQGGLSLLQGQVAAAEQDFSESVNMLSHSLDVTALRGETRAALLKSILLLAAQKGPSEAEKVLDPVLRNHPDDPFLLSIQADLKFKQGQFDTGMKILDQVEALQPGRPDAPYIKASVYLQRGQVAEALVQAERALSLDAKHLPSMSLAARLNLMAGNNEQAIQQAKTIIGVMPQAWNEQIWNLYLIQVEALSRLKRTGEAEQLLRQLLEKEPKFLAMHRALIALKTNEGHLDEAIAVCRAARELLPESLPLVVDEIILLCRDKQLAAAEELAKKVAGDPLNAETALALAQAFGQSNELELAKAWAEKALTGGSDAQKVAAHLFLGDIALRQNQAKPDANVKSQARQHYEEVLKIAPQHVVAGNNLAWLLATDFQEPGRAVEIMEKVRGPAPVAAMPVDFVDTLAEVYRRANRAEDAEKVLNEALKLAPNEPKLVYQLGMTLVARGQPGLARNSLQRAVQLGLPENRAQEVSRTLANLDAEEAVGKSKSKPAPDEKP